MVKTTKDKTTKGTKNTKTTKGKTTKGKTTKGKTTKTTKGKTVKNEGNGKTLVIVEAPGKIEKMSKILGKDYVVTSSRGHIMDLPIGELAVDINNDYEPTYVFDDPGMEEKTRSMRTNTRNNIIKLAKECSKVVIASDKDREGEMIGWAYEQLLKKNNLDRISFGAITKNAIQEALDNVGKLDMDMVYSQQARRIIDRLAGYKLSGVVRNFMGIGNVTVGRVQSVLVRLICDKEDEINKFFSSDEASYFKYSGDFTCKINNNKNELKCQTFTVDDNDKYTKYVSNDYKTSAKIMKQFIKAKFSIASVIEREFIANPPQPFNTSTCMQAASSELGFNAKRTMSTLQKLYEKAYTTYLRTDSMEISPDGHELLKKYINKNHPKMYRKNGIKKKKDVKLQEGHEAIRPIKFKLKTLSDLDGVTPDEIRLYDLIWRRTVSSQMISCEMSSFDIYIENNKNDILFKNTITQTKKPGFKKVLKNAIADYDPSLVPDTSTKIKMKLIECTEDYAKPPSRYNEQSLIKIMDPDHLNIGRPATTSSLINTIQSEKKGYVKIQNVDGIQKDSRVITIDDKSKVIEEKVEEVKLGKENNRFCPTTVGKQLVNVLVEYYPELMDYKFTEKMEKELDKVAEGKISKNKVIDNFWKTIEPKMEEMKNAQRGNVVGIHPEYNVEITARNGKYGPMVEMTYEGRHYTGSINSVEDVTLEEAVNSMSKYLGDAKYSARSKEHPVFIKCNHNGHYIQHFKRYAQIPDDVDRTTITLEKALEMLQAREDEKNKKNQERISKYKFYCKIGVNEYIVNTGKRGLYILEKKKRGKDKFYSIPDDTDTESLTVDKLKQLMEESIERKKRYYNNKRNNKKK